MSLLGHIAAQHTGTSTDFVRTLTAGSNRLALVCIQQEGLTANTFTATLDSVAMTPIAAASGQVASAGNSQHHNWFGLLAPDLGTGDVTLTSTSLTTEDNTSVHFILFDGVAQNLSFVDISTDFSAGTGNPKTVSLNPTSTSNYNVVSISGCGNDTDYVLTYDGDDPDSTTEVDTGATTTGATGVWVAKNNVGNNTLSATSSADVNRQGLSAFIIAPASTTQTGGRQRREVINPAVGGIVLSDDYLETLLPIADNYEARITCTMNRQCVLHIELYELGVLETTIVEAFPIPNDTDEHQVSFTTSVPNTVVRITFDSITPPTGAGVTLLMDCEVVTALGDFPTDQ